MPGRKSGVSVVSNGGDDASEITATPRAPKEGKDKDGLSVEDISLPRSMINRLAKGVLAPNTQIGKDALLALHKSATVFVSYIASNSNELAQAGGKKTIMPHDVLAALKDAEFEGFLPRLEAELKKYNDTQCDKRNNYRRKVKEEKAAAAAKDGTTLDDTTEGSIITANGHAQQNGDDEAERPFKKVRTSDGGVAVPRDDADDVDEDDEGDDEDMDDDDAEDEDEEEEEVFEDAEENVNVGDESMEDVDDTFAGRGREMRDEALDEPDSD